jgi:hypothetical protein
MVAMVIPRRTLLLGGALGLAAATGTGVLLRERSGPILDPPAGGTAPDGYLVAAYKPDPLSWRVFDPRTGRYVARAGDFAAPSPDLRYILTTHEAQQRSRSTRILDTGTGAVVHDFGRQGNLPLGWSRDGRHVVLGGTSRHHVDGREDDYDTLDEVRVVDVASGHSRAVAGWRPVRLSTDLPPWWTTDGRLVCGDRLIAMDGTVALSPVAVDGGLPVLGTDRVVSVGYTGGSYLTGEHAADLVAGTATAAVPGEIDAKWAGIDYSGLRWLAWLDDDRLVGLRDHDLVAVDPRSMTRQVFMTFPDDVVTDALIAPAVGVPATVH